MSILSLIKGRGASGFGYGSTADQVLHGIDLHGQTILVTGCASGLGAETMRALCARGARVIGAARSFEQATLACAQIEGEAHSVACDLSEPASVRRAIASVQQMGLPLDAIIANAGIMALPQLQQKHGYELQFLTNHIGHHLLITGLLDQLAENGRVVVLTSVFHNKAPRAGIEFDNLSGNAGYSPWTAYGQSKLANLLFAKHLATKLPKPGQTANAVHPGTIKTRLQRNLGSTSQAAFSFLGAPFFKTIAQGAATTCYVATHPQTATVSGAYFADCNIAQPDARANNTELAKKLWETTAQIIASFPAPSGDIAQR